MAELILSSPTRDKTGCLDISDLAEFLGVSTRHIERLIVSGRFPRPIRLGRVRRWFRADFEAWVAAGCPEVAEFSARKEWGNV